MQSLGVNSVAVTKAVQRLEREGLVTPQGDRRSRLISKAARSREATLKVGMLYYDDATGGRQDALSIKQELSNAGHSVLAAPKSMMEMGMDVARIARLVWSMDVDAWVVFAGSGQILQWFEQSGKPAFALHGRLDQTNLAGFGIRKIPVIATLVDRLANRGVMAPKHVSLFCNDMERSFMWTRPEISHIRWDYRPSVRRVIQWANHVAQGREDRRNPFIKASLYEGGTIVPAPEPLESPLIFSALSAHSCFLSPRPVDFPIAHVHRADTKFLHHRPHRPWEDHSFRPPDGSHEHGYDARKQRPAARFDGS